MKTQRQFRFQLDPRTIALFGADIACNTDPHSPSAVQFGKVRSLMAECVKDFPCHDYIPSKQEVDKRLTFNGAIILEDSEEPVSAKRVVYKPLGFLESARSEFVSILANLLGIRTPLVFRTRVIAGGRHVGDGASTFLIEPAFTAEDLCFESLLASEARYLIRTRWLNELVGNLECWWGQFLVVLDGQNSKALVMVDLDGAFSSISPGFLKHALETHYGRQDVALRDCGWLDREYSLTSPFGWDPKHYDSPFSFYGPLPATWSNRLRLCKWGSFMSIPKVPTATLTRSRPPLTFATRSNAWR